MLHVVTSENLEVGLAVSEEVFDVIMSAFEVFGLLHEHGLDVAHGRGLFNGIYARGSHLWGTFIVLGSGKRESVRLRPGSVEWVSARLLLLPHLLDLLLQVVGP